MKNKRIMIISIIIAIIVVIAIGIYFFMASKQLSLSEFEKIAIYGYFEDHLSLDKLYLLSGDSSYDELHYTQSKIKQILDSHYSQNPENTIPTSTISSDLETQYGISSNSIDYHGILISDYEFLPEENAFQRVEGANQGLSSIENSVDLDTKENGKLSVTNIEKLSKDSYKIYFDVVDSLAENQILNSGNVTIRIVDGNYQLESCSFEN